jgi:hypothetical protein
VPIGSGAIPSEQSAAFQWTLRARMVEYAAEDMRRDE